MKYTLLFVSLFAFLQLHAQCSANAGPDTAVCIGSTIQLGGVPAGTGPGILSYSWSPATGISCSNCANPTLTVTTNQTYTLTVTSSTGCSATNSVQVTALALPTASFTVNGNNNCSNIPISFTNTSTGTGLTYSWNFGDPISGSNTSTATNPAHTFSATGAGSVNYTVTLVVTNSNGCSASTNASVTALAVPGPTLVDPIAGMRNCDGSNFPITLYDASATSAISNYVIQWGDGTPNYSSTSFPGSGVNHTYTTAEIFSLNYIVTGTNGCIDTAQYNIANITNPAIGAANPGATTGCGPLTLCFPLNNYQSNHNTTYYVVNYGDGSPKDTLPHPPPSTICHTYTLSSCGQGGNQFIFRISAINMCDSSAASISPIRVYTGPQANFNPAAINNCVNTPVTFINSSITGFNSSCSASTLFQWNFGDGQTLTTTTTTNPAHVYTVPGTYTVTLTTTNSCGSNTQTREVCIEVPPVPSFALNPDTTCVPFISATTNTSTLLNTCDVTRNWSVIFNGSSCVPGTAGYSFTGGTNASSLNPQIQFSNAGNYTVQLALTNSCGTYTTTQPIVAQTIPQVSINPLGPICANTSVNPVAVVNSCLEPADSYNWTFSGGTPNTSTSLSPGSILYPTSGTFNISFSATNLCGTGTANSSILVNPIPPVLNPIVNSPLCVGDTAHFTSTFQAGVSYSWTGPNSFASSLQNFNLNSITTTQAGTYTLTGSMNGCQGPSSTVNLIVNPIPVVSVTPSSPTICFGNSVSLTASGATSYVWSPATGLSATTGATVNANPTSTQTYTVIGSTGSCSGTAQATVTINPLPPVNAGPDTTVCNLPLPFQLSATPSGGTWTGLNVSSSGTFTPNGTGTFTLTYSYTDAFGCSNSDSRIVTVIAPTQPNAGNDSSICFNAPSITLTPSPIGGTWTGSNVSPAGVFTPSSLGNNTLVYHYGSGACLLTDTILITVNPLPVVDAGPGITVCIDAPIQNLAGTPSGGTWTGTGITNSTGQFSPAVAGSGTVILTYSYTDISGCTNSDNTNALVNPLPLVNAGPDSTACNQPLPFQLGASPAGGIWSGTNVSPTGLFTPNGTGSFTLTYSFTNANGCTGSDSRILTINNPTTVNAGPDFSICIGSPAVNLSPSPSGGIWSGTSVTSAGVFTPNTVGTFNLIYQLGSGACFSSDTLIAIVNPLPVVNVGSDLNACIDANPITLTGSPVGGVWSGTGITNPTGIFTPSVALAGAHTLTYSYTNGNGCTNTDQLVFTVNPIPVVNAGADTTLCNQPIPVSFTGTPSGGTWSGPNITSSGIFTASGTGTFTISYSFTNASGCTNTDQRIITVNNPIQPNAGADFAVCIDAPNVTLNGLPVGGSWTGANTTSTGIFDPTTAGTFSLVYSLGQGTCLMHDTVLVTVNPLPIVNAGNDFTLCISAPAINLAGSPIGGTWSGNGITSAGQFTASTAGNGTHTLTYTYVNGNGCTSSDALLATINPLPVVNAGVDTTLCNQAFPVQFTATPAGGTWSGSGISPSGSFIPSAVGSFSVTYTFTNGLGCTNSDSRVITVVNPVVSNAGPDLAACIDAPNVQLNGTPLSGTWTGSYVSSSGVFNPTIAGTFALVISNGAGNCLTRDTMLFTVHPLPVVNAGPNASFCPNNPAVTFTGTPVGGTWSGTGITNASTGNFNPGIAGVGSHNIIYTYTNPVTGCLNRDTLLAIVHPFPVAQFNYNPIACLGIAETYTNTSSLGTSYQWDFGDGTGSVITSPSHTFNSAGFFNVEVVAVSAFGCLDSITHTIEVRVPPIANFSLVPDSACGPLTVSFTDLSSGPSLTYNWNYGNGQTSSNPIPTNQTYQAGVLADTLYTVSLTLTNFCGTDQHTESIQVMPSPTAIFGTNTNIGCSPLNLDIVNNSIGLPDTYSWTFGDGTSSTSSASTLQHLYTTGTSDTTYTIQLIVTNECGSDTVTHAITVLPNQVNAFFNVDNPSGCVPHTVNFTQFSQGSNFSAWDFGDGNGATTYNATHTFTQPGTYTVSLFANDGCGYDTTTAIITVFPSPVVDFSSSPDSVCINELFTFTNLSSNVASVSWDFGDGSNSILFNPQHAYASSGIFQVTLSGVSQTNGCVGSITKPIVVSLNPVAAFSPSPNAGCEDLFVSFTNQSINSTFQAWDFGDGNFSTAISPTHTYTSAGSYTVKLYVENANGCSDSIEHIITVYPLPIASFTSIIDDPCTQPATATFSNSSSGAMNYNWDFGNGQQSALTNPTSSYLTAGTYQVSLIATSLQGCKDTAYQTLTIYNQAVASFTLPDDSLCVGESAQFLANYQYSDSLHWDFGNGTIITGNPVNYYFTGSGVYPITLIAYGQGGCNDTVTINTPIVIVPSPTANFTFVNVQAPDPLSGTVEFTNLSNRQLWNYWDFGNGDTSTALNPIERYESFGDFLTTLIVGNEFGCTDTIQQLIDVDFFYGLHIPNAIYPGHSDFQVANFIPKGVGLKTFELLIYDDWGNLIWSTNALDANGRPTEYWDGTFNGVPVQQDAYVWKCTATFMNEKVWEGKEYSNGKIKRAGTVTVIR